jgi:glycosyltransferase involved in cell wall biosynthesis
MTGATTFLRVAHVAWGYLGGGVDSVLDSYLQADEMHPGRVVSYVVVIRDPRESERKLPNATGGCSLIARRAGELWLAVRDTADRLWDFAPDVLMLHGFNATILGLPLRSHLPRDLPIVSSYHGKYFARSLKDRAKAALFNRLELRFFRTHANAVIAVSHHSAAQLQANRVPETKIIVLHNAVALGSPPVAPKVHSDADGRKCEVKLISVSRLAPEKGIDVLLRAFSELSKNFPAVALNIVGEGSLRAELAELTNELGLSGSVHFLGNRTDVADLLAQADIFVMTSRQENHSIAILEAMRAGLPLVLSDVGGNTESVRDGLDGYIVPDLDPAAAAAAMTRLVASGELRARFGASARARYESEFESVAMIDRFLGALTSLTRVPEEKRRG